MEIKCVVLAVDQEKQRIALGLKQLTEDPWLHAVPERYVPGMIVQGKVTKITNFGVFVELEQDLEGLLHVSELTDRKIDDPHEEVEIGQEIEVKILRVDSAERKIGLSKKRADWAASGGDDSGEGLKGDPRQRRGGLHGFGEETTDIIRSTVFHTEPAGEKRSDQEDRKDSSAGSGAAEREADRVAEPAAEVDLAAEAAPPADAEPATEAAPAAETEPATEAAPAAEAEPAAEADPAGREETQTPEAQDQEEVSGSS
jgi:predicted RNA-binding protein with RPS1 domain